jgi:hypothetical protein
MIEEDYCSFETAKLLKEKGFDWNTDKQFNLDKIVGDYNITDRSRHPERYLDAPTLQMAMKWLREKHIVIIPDVENFYMDGGVASWIYHVWCADNLEESDSIHFNTYKEACEAGIRYSLENLI